MDRRLRERASDERASVITELALILPLLIMLVVGAVDLGGVMSANGQLAVAAQEGSRVGSSLGTTTGTDRQILLATASGLEDIPLDEVELVVVFKAATPDADVPPQCLTPAARIIGGNVGRKCNTYSGWKFRQIVTNPASATWFTDPDCSFQMDWFWCPSDRNNVQTTSSPPDNLGVYIELKHGTRSGLFVDDVTIKDDSISAIVPGAGD